MNAQYSRPTRVKWLFPKEALAVTKPLEWISYIPSKSIRALALQLDAVLEQAGLVYTIEPLTAESYSDWRKFYAEQMSVQHHEVLAKPDWFEHRKVEYPEILLVEIRRQEDGHRVGAAIILRKVDGEWNKPYRASLRIALPRLKNVSIGALLDLLSLRYIFAHKPTLVKSGASRNAFGCINTLGYLAYKLKIGYEPWLFPEFSLEDEYPRLTEETPTAWFVMPEGSQGTLQRMERLVVSPSTAILSDELRKYLEFRKIEVVAGL